MTDKLTSVEPEPEVGTLVRDSLGRLWRHDDDLGVTCWVREDLDDDPESWTKVAGNYGPVTVQK